MQSLFSNYQQTSNNIANIETEDNDVGVLETTTSSSSIIATQLTEYLEAESQSTLFVPFLGQSNGQHMSFIYDSYETSGAIALDRELTDLTGRNIVTSDTSETNFAIGGSKVNGNGYYLDDNYVWWYPEQNQPGGALLQAEQGLQQWFSDNGAQPADEIAIVWSQGESDVGDIYAGDPATKEAYKQSTLAVFDYLRNNLGYSNITFYLVPTGRIQQEAAANAGLDAQEIAAMNEGLAVIRETQSEIATERDDVQLAADYSDLNMVYEEGQIYGESYDQNYNQWSTDFWHLGHDGLQVNGDRLAQYIALDRGQNNVISFTDSFGNPAQSISLARDGILDINIAENSNQEIIQGTDNPDVVVGSLAADQIIGGNGNDIIVGSQGGDTLTGGTGDDVFFYNSLTNLDIGIQSDRIVDFEVGSDRLDISEPLSLSGYSGSDPIADGYVVVTSLDANNIEIQFDGDGAGAQPASTFAVLENTNSAEFQNDINSQFIFTPTEF